MKTVARILIVIACLALAVVTGYVITSQLSLSGKISAEPATNDEEVFAALKNAVENGEYAGVEKLDEADKYHLITVRADIRSYSPFRAEWINLRVESADGARIIDKDTRFKNGDAPVDLTNGDLLVIGKNAWIRQIDSFGKLDGDGSMYFKLLSATNDPPLHAYLEYYIFGRYHSLEIPLIG